MLKLVYVNLIVTFFSYQSEVSIVPDAAPDMPLPFPLHITDTISALSYGLHDDDDDDADIHCAGLVWRQVRTCFLRQRRWFASDVGKVERWVGGLRLMTLRVDFPVGPSHDKSTQLDTIKKCGQRKDVYALQKDVFSEYLALLHSLKISMFLY